MAWGSMIPFNDIGSVLERDSQYAMSAGADERKREFNKKVADSRVQATKSVKDQRIAEIKARINEIKRILEVNKQESIIPELDQETDLAWDRAKSKAGVDEKEMSLF